MFGIDRAHDAGKSGLYGHRHRMNTSCRSIDSPLSRVTWRDGFAANSLPMTGRPRPSFDRAALAISAAADGRRVVPESTRLAAFRQRLPAQASPG
ncbi:hypothetical protein [Paraburkholderia hiiakae]|uniref:hypothetical protein n=1 Tax=Paraburkholderia hiiakae TaxID=1081782 RepID=UPI002E2AD906|nr:hypothetical protein [Paraburkholderia hiiakae]